MPFLYARRWIKKDLVKIYVRGLLPMFSFKSFIVPHPMFQSLIHFIFVYGVQASVVAQLVKNLPAMQEIWVRSLGWEGPLRRERLPTPVFWLREFH